MNRLTKIFTRSLLSIMLAKISLLGLPASAQTNYEQNKVKKESEKYAIIYTASDCRKTDENIIHPIDENAFWISTVRAYNELLKYGVSPKNIFVLYKDAKPDFSDPLVKNVKEAIQQEFKGCYSNIASKKNFKIIEKLVEQKVEYNDTLIMYIGTHGFENGTLGSAYDNSLLSPSELSNMLNDNESKKNLVVFESCYAKNFIDKLTANGTFIGASEDVAGWVDRDFSFGSLFFEDLNDLDNDTNYDGIISYEEAFRAAKSEYFKRGISKKKFILTEYLKCVERSSLKEVLKRINFRTMMRKVY